MNKTTRSGEIVPLVDRHCSACGASYRAAAKATLCKECGAPAFVATHRFRPCAK